MLIPITKRTEEEQRDMRIRAGKASGIARRKKKELKERLKSLLSSKGKNGKEYGEEMCLALIAKAIAGSEKAFELIRDTIGEKPVNKVTGAVRTRGRMKLILLGEEERILSK